jgi:hypothetical protein
VHEIETCRQLGAGVACRLSLTTASRKFRPCTRPGTPHQSRPSHLVIDGPDSVPGAFHHGPKEGRSHHVREVLRVAEGNGASDLGEQVHSETPMGSQVLVGSRRGKVHCPVRILEAPASCGGALRRIHLDRVVRGSEEETLKALLDAEADRLCNAESYERSKARQDTRAGITSAISRPRAGEAAAKLAAGAKWQTNGDP